MRQSVVAFLACFSICGAGLGHAQGLLAKPGPQHVSLSASASAGTATPGGTVTLWADVTPNPGTHIYAEGAKDFTPVSLVVTPNGVVTAGKPKYPKAAVATAPGATDAVPAYTQPFRIALPVTIRQAAKPGAVVTIAAALNYQACDDRLCYPVSVAPVVWTVSVK